MTGTFSSQYGINPWLSLYAKSLHSLPVGITLDIVPFPHLEMSIMRLSLSLALLIGIASIASAKVMPHALFSSNMVIQRDVEVPIYGTADPGEEVTIEVKHPVKTTQKANLTGQTIKADSKGHWQTALGNFDAGTVLTITVKGSDNSVTLDNVVAGDVWVCSGQSNMEWRIRQLTENEQGTKVAERANNPELRLFIVPNRISKTPRTELVAGETEGVWQVADPKSVAEFSAVGYFFGQKLQQDLNVPIGLIASEWGGTPAEAWTPKEKLQSLPVHKNYRPKTFTHHSPSSLYNGMIEPLLKFPIKGAIWYQGESNSGRAYGYRTLFPAMIESWREAWGQEFPFLLVQLAPYKGAADGVNYAELRDAQLLATKKLPKVGMAVITDVGHKTNIHPQQKQPVGERLALAARALAYDEAIEYSGPIFKEMKIEGNKATLKFDHVGQGLMAKGNELTGFTVAGPDKVFHPAKATIEGNSVIVESDDVAKPVAVRYGWVNFAEPTLNFFNQEGLPASPFRTDDYPMVTMPKK